MSRCENGKENCKLCNREPGLPILLTRYAIGPKPGLLEEECYKEYATYHGPSYREDYEDYQRGRSTVKRSVDYGLTDNIKDIDGNEMKLDDYTAYVHRTLRKGYVYLYIEGAKPSEWREFFSTGGGYLEEIPASGFFINKKEYSDKPPCKPEPGADKSIACYITIPNYKNYDKMWVCFSEVRWTKAVWFRHLDKTYRNRHMRVVNLKNMRGEKHALPHKTTNLLKIAEMNYDIMDGFEHEIFGFSKAAIKRRPIGGEIFTRFNDSNHTTEIDGNNITLIDSYSITEKIQEDDDAFILALDDPAGIAMDLGSLMDARHDAFLNQIRYNKAAVSGHIAIFKNRVEEEAIKNYLITMKKNKQKWRKNKTMPEGDWHGQPMDPLLSGYPDLARNEKITEKEYLEKVWKTTDDWHFFSDERKKALYMRLRNGTVFGDGIIPLYSPYYTGGDSLDRLIKDLTVRANIVRGIEIREYLDSAREWAWEPYRFATDAARHMSGERAHDANRKQKYDFENGLPLKNGVVRIRNSYDLLERYDEEVRKKVQSEFNAAHKDFITKIINPMAEAHARWMKSVSLAEYMTCNFDGNEAESCKTFTDVFVMCIDGSTDKTACMSVYKGWLDDETWVVDAGKIDKEKLTAADKNLLIRALLLDSKTMLEALSKATGDMTKVMTEPMIKKIGSKFNTKSEIWKSVTKDFKNEMKTKFNISDPAASRWAIFEMLADSIMSHLYDNIGNNEDLSKTKCVAMQLILGSYQDTPIVTVRATDVESAFAQFAYNRGVRMALDYDKENKATEKEYAEAEDIVEARMKALSLDGVIDYQPEINDLKKRIKELKEDFANDKVKYKEGWSTKTRGRTEEEKRELHNKILGLEVKVHELRNKQKEVKMTQTFIVGVQWKQYASLMDEGVTAGITDLKGIEEFRKQLDQNVIEAKNIETLEFIFQGLWGSVVESYSSLESGVKSAKSAVEAVNTVGGAIGHFVKNQAIYNRIDSMLKYTEATKSVLGVLVSFTAMWKSGEALFNPKVGAKPLVMETWGKFFASMTTNAASVAKMIEGVAKTGYFLSKYGVAASEKWGLIGKTWGKWLGVPAMAVSVFLSVEKAYHASADGSDTLSGMYICEALLGLGMIIVLCIEAPLIATATMFLLTFGWGALIVLMKDNDHQVWLSKCCFGHNKQKWSKAVEAAEFSNAKFPKRI